MRNINNESCTYMKIGNGKLVNFSSEIPDITNGNVKVRYYLTKNLESLEEEFKDNINIVSVDLSKMNTSMLTTISHAFDGCINLEKVNLGNIESDVNREGAFANINKTGVTVITNDPSFTDDITYEIVNPKDTLVISMPTANTIITSERVSTVAGMKYNFYANASGIKIPVILSNWDNYDDYCSTKNPKAPELPYFLNTQHCKDLGEPAEEMFVSKNNKNSVVTTPRLCIADNDVLTVTIPEELEIDYFVIHASGHNGAMSEFDYVYGAEDGVHMESQLIVPASEGTSDIVVRCRDKRTEYKIFNGTIENNKKVWISIDFYKYHSLAKRPELPPVAHVNPPIPDEVYVQLGEYTKISTSINALSGICLDPEDASKLYGVSDTYGLYKIDIATGESELIVEIGLDMEGICVGPDNDLFACIENDQMVIRFSKDSNYTTYSVASTPDADKLLETMKEWNNGFEGIAYNPTSGNIYLGNQFKPISVTEYSIVNGIVGEPFELKFNNEIGGTTEIGDMQYDPENNCLWVIDSRSANIYKYDMQGNNLASYTTGLGSKPNTESLFIDFKNNKLYVGCDNATGDIYIFDFNVHSNEDEPGTPGQGDNTSGNEEETELSISLYEESVELEIGSEKQLTATVTPENAEITWVSSKESVATVSENGLVTAIAEGETTITVSVSDDVKASCVVTVKAKEEEPELSISLDEESVELEIGSEKQLTATVTPENAEITWVSSKESVATVSENGLVTAIAEGETTITVSVSDDVKASCVVTVKAKEEEQFKYWYGHSLSSSANVMPSELTEATDSVKLEDYEVTTKNMFILVEKTVGSLLDESSPLEIEAKEGVGDPYNWLESAKVKNDRADYLVYYKNAQGAKFVYFDIKKNK